MKKIIYQNVVYEHDLHPLKRSLFDDACRTIERYAGNINSEYLISKKNYFKGYDSIWGIFRILDDPLFLEYDQILFIDGDVFARNTDYDIFKKYKQFSACRNLTNENSKRRPEYKIFGDRFLNSGIVMFTPESIEKFRNLDIHKYMKTYKSVKPGRDQLALNIMVKDSIGDYNEIDKSDACYLKDDEAETAPLVHLAGRCRDKYFAEQKHWDNLFEVKDA